MKIYLACVMLLLACFAVKAQTTFAKNAIYLEAGGAGLFGSVNYERQLTSKPGPGIRVGVGFYAENGFYYTIPVAVNYLFPLKDERSMIEAGINVSWARQEETYIGSNHTYVTDKFANVVPLVGYRRHTKSNMMWRIAVSPVFNKYDVTPWGGIALGKRF